MKRRVGTDIGVIRIESAFIFENAFFAVGLLLRLLVVGKWLLVTRFNQHSSGLIVMKLHLLHPYLKGSHWLS